MSVFINFKAVGLKNSVVIMEPASTRSSAVTVSGTAMKVKMNDFATQLVSTVMTRRKQVQDLYVNVTNVAWMFAMNMLATARQMARGDDGSEALAVPGGRWLALLGPGRLMACRCPTSDRCQGGHLWVK